MTDQTKEFHVLWMIDLDAQSHEDAARKALAIQQEKGSTATVFQVSERGSNQAVTIDMDVEGTVLIDERTFTPKQRLEAILARVNAEIALARQISDEPFSIQIDDVIDIEVQPLCDNDNRIIVGREGWGSTTVNYTSEGLAVDSYAQNEMDSAVAYWLSQDDLMEPEHANS